MAASISASVLMPAKMPEFPRFASTPPLQRHPRKAPARRPGSGARNAVARHLRDLRGREDR
jgi:hypothetical protein